MHPILLNQASTYGAFCSYAQTRMNESRRSATAAQLATAGVAGVARLLALEEVQAEAIHQGNKNEKV